MGFAMLNTNSNAQVKDKNFTTMNVIYQTHQATRGAAPA